MEPSSCSAPMINVCQKHPGLIILSPWWPFPLIWAILGSCLIQLVISTTRQAQPQHAQPQGMLVKLLPHVVTCCHRGGSTAPITTLDLWPTSQIAQALPLFTLCMRQHLPVGVVGANFGRVQREQLKSGLDGCGQWGINGLEGPSWLCRSNRADWFVRFTKDNHLLWVTIQIYRREFICPGWRDPTTFIHFHRFRG